MRQLINTKEDHVERVLRSTSSSSAAALSQLAASWYRSSNKYGLQPDDKHCSRRIVDYDLRQRMDAMGNVLKIAGPRLDELFNLVGKSGCTVLLTDASGIVVDQRSNTSDEMQFAEWGLVKGADWSEATEGTNAVGTSIIENRKMIIHRDEHFYARNIGVSCVATPIYGCKGHLVGVLDVSSARDDQSQESNKILASIIAHISRRIETDIFRAAYPGTRILVAESHDFDANSLLAIDNHDLVVGATRAARQEYKLGMDGNLEPRPTSDLIGRKSHQTDYLTSERSALIRELVRSNKNVSLTARKLGVGRATLYRRLSKLDIQLANL